MKDLFVLKDRKGINETILQYQNQTTIFPKYNRLEVGKSKSENILRVMCSKPIKLIHIQNLLPDFCLSLPILDLISDKMPSWRQFLPYVSRLKKSLQCQLLLKLYRPSFSCISTHAHVCTHCNTILTLHLCDCYHVNESIQLTYFCVS